MLNKIADQIPAISKVADPQRPRSGWIHGVKDLQVACQQPGRVQAASRLSADSLGPNCHRYPPLEALHWHFL